MSETIKIAIAGLGNVGQGVVKLIEQNQDLLKQRCGKHIQIIAVSAQNYQKKRDISLEKYQWFDDAVHMASEANADIVVELIGGVGGVAHEVCMKGLSAGAHIVTANKALIAIHGFELAMHAKNVKRQLAFEAAVAGGIPIVKILREGLCANHINAVYGILNGTCNYILTKMEDTHQPFDVVLKEAQEKGYAEADPSFDIDGIDTAHKLAILTSLAFSTKVNYQTIYVEGIKKISPLDIFYAKEMGYHIKLLGITQNTDKGILQRVHPCLVPADHMLAKMSGVTNAVVPIGDFVGSTVYQGAGAGQGPTASAIVADIMDIIRSRFTTPPFGVDEAYLKDIEPTPMSDYESAYYIRLNVVDMPGVLADITTILSHHKISIESVYQPSRQPGELVPVIMKTHQAKDQDIKKALKKISALDSVQNKVLSIHIEDLA